MREFEYLKRVPDTLFDRVTKYRLMEKQITHETRLEHGSAAIELAMLAPIIILFASFMLDVTTYLTAIMNVDRISTAAASYVGSRNAKEVNEEALRDAMKSSFPSIAASGADVQISLTKEKIVKEQLSYPIFIDGTQTALETQSNYDVYTVSVTKSQSWPFLGNALSDNGDRFTVRSQKHCEADNMQESTWNIKK